MVGLHRSPDRHRRRQRFRQGRRRVRPEAAERAMHRCNQPRELIDTDTVLRDITTDDLRDQAGIDFLCTAVIGHIFCPNVVDWDLCSRAWLRLQFPLRTFLNEVFIIFKQSFSADLPMLTWPPGDRSRQPAKGRVAEPGFSMDTNVVATTQPDCRHLSGEFSSFSWAEPVFSARGIFEVIAFTRFDFGADETELSGHRLGGPVKHCRGSRRKQPWLNRNRLFNRIFSRKRSGTKDLKMADAHHGYGSPMNPARPVGAPASVPVGPPRTPELARAADLMRPANSSLRRPSELPDPAKPDGEIRQLSVGRGITLSGESLLRSC